MAAPSSDFESADYPLLRACSLPSRGLWSDMRVLMKQSRRPGYLHQEGHPLSLRQLAQVAGMAGPDEARPLLDELIAAGVCAHSETDGYYSPRIVGFERFRRAAAKSGKRGGNPILLNENRAKRTLKGCTLKGGVKGRDKGSPADPSPQVSPSPFPIPLSSSSSSPTPERSDLSTNPTAADKPPAAGGSDSEKGAGEPGLPKGAKFPPGAWARAVKGWETAFRFVHRTEFVWNSRQFRGLRDVLAGLDADLTAFEAVAKAWLREPQVGRAKGHPLWQLAEDLNYVRSRIASGDVGKPAGGTNGHAETPEQYARRLVAAGEE